MIRDDGFYQAAKEYIRKKSRAIVVVTFLVQTAICFGYLIYYFLKPSDTHSTANDEFYVTVVISLVVFNLMFLMLGILKGYVLHIITYLIISIFLSFVFDYIVYAIVGRKSIFSTVEWVMFLIGGVLMPLCTVIQIVLAPSIYKYFKEVTLEVIGASVHIWEIYWHTSLVKAMSILQELLYIYLSLFSFMYQCNNYMDIIMELAIIVLFTIQCVFAYLMIQRSQKALFPGWIILDFYSFFYMIFKVICIFKDKTLSWDNIGIKDVDLKDHYVASTTMLLLLIIVFTLSLVGGMRCISNIGTIDHKQLLRRLNHESASMASSEDRSFEIDSKDD
jgi:hypothetical protein